MSIARLLLKTASTAALFATMAASAGAAPADYSFEIVNPPAKTAAGYVTTVRLLGPSGQPVPNAEVFYRDLVQPNPKAMSSIQRRIPLSADGRGDYRLVTRERPSPLRLGATVPGERAIAYALVPVSGD